MKIKEISFVALFVFVLMVAIGTSKLFGQSETASSTKEVKTTVVSLPQLTADGRPDAATMGLLGAPPMQPADHIERWNPEQHHESCMACHANPATGAPTPPKNHFYDENQKGKIFRDNCQQCHATQNDTKPAFNREK